MVSKLVALMPVRNEDWCLGWTLRALLMWVDEVVVLNHASTDCTAQIISEVRTEHPTRVTQLLDVNPTWTEMAHRQQMLDVARVRLGATRIVMVDADEVLTGNLLPTVRQMILDTPRNSIFELPWIAMRGGLNQYHHRRGPWAGRKVSVAFEDLPGYHWTARAGYDFHHRHPMGAPYKPHWTVQRACQGGLMHLQFVSDARLRAKQALYKMLEVTRWPGRSSVDEINKLYNLAVYGAELPTTRPHDLAQSPAEWLAPYEALLRYYKPDAEAWQAQEVRRLWNEHGAETFSGLDLFGVVK